jgi:hypothetical protein
VGLMNRLFGGATPSATQRTERMVVETGVAESPGELVEIEVVGESHYQDALERIAGPKEADGKEVRVGATRAEQRVRPERRPSRGDGTTCRTC